MTKDVAEAVERLREDAEREERLARECSDPISRAEHETRADTFWRRHDRARQTLGDQS